MGMSVISHVIDSCYTCSHKNFQFQLSFIFYRDSCRCASIIAQKVLKPLNFLQEISKFKTKCFLVTLNRFTSSVTLDTAEKFQSTFKSFNKSACQFFLEYIY